MSTTGCCRSLSANDCIARPYGCADDRLPQITLTPEQYAILQSLRDNHLAMRLRACPARRKLKDAGYIKGGRSGNWKADRRHTYWHLTPTGYAALSDMTKDHNTK